MKIEFGGKVKKRLDFPQQQILGELIEKVLNYPEEIFEDLVWEFTVSPGKAAVTYGEFFPEELDKKQLSAVRSELISQYRKKHPEWDFGKKHLKSPYKDMEIFYLLRRATLSDEVVMHRILQRLEAYLEFFKEDEEFIRRTIYLLESKEERKFCGGLKELGFSKRDVAFLKPCAYAIGVVLKMNYWRYLSEKRAEV